MDHFDLAIIGAGSGNSLLTPDFDDARVAIIESGPFGGTCLNVGCIPTKMFVYPADVAAAVRTSAQYGIDAAFEGARWEEIRDRVFGRIDPIAVAGQEYRVNGQNTTAFLGRARFTGDRRLAVALNDGGTAELSADQVVIATGSRVAILPALAQSGVRYHTSDTIMRIDEQPTRLIILGAGYIAAEFAHVFGAFGTSVTLLARGDTLLRNHDADIARQFTKLACRRWDVRLGVTATRFSERSGQVSAHLADGTTVSADLLLAATGRVPNTGDLALDAAGVQVGEGGRILVDAHGRTSAPGVWSLGDVSSPYELKHVANHEARVVAHNLAHPEDLRSFDHRFVPSAVFTHPQIASVGPTEAELVAAGARFVAATQLFGDVAYGWAMEDTSGFCKVLADPATGHLLGAHILGHEASILIQPLIQAMSLGQTAREVATGQYWIHPSLAEVIENVLLRLELDD